MRFVTHNSDVPFTSALPFSYCGHTFQTALITRYYFATQGQKKWRTLKGQGRSWDMLKRSNSITFTI